MFLFLIQKQWSICCPLVACFSYNMYFNCLKFPCTYITERIQKRTLRRPLMHCSCTRYDISFEIYLTALLATEDEGTRLPNHPDNTACISNPADGVYCSLAGMCKRLYANISGVVKWIWPFVFQWRPPVCKPCH